MTLGTIYIIIYYIGRLTAIIHTKCRTLQKDIKPSALISADGFISHSSLKDFLYVI